MRLKSVFISQYKNLRNFSLDFDGTSFIDVFVGKNGSGKSNLFEALIEIFRHLDESRTSITAFPFDYRIGFEISGSETAVKWESGKLTINGHARKTTKNLDLPENVLIYYTGHNKTVRGLVERNEADFRKKIKGAELKESRRFIEIGSEYKSLLIAVLLLQPEQNEARQFICRKLGIQSVGEKVRLVLKRPSFASGRLKQLDVDSIDLFDPRTHYWGALGITRQFIDQLAVCIREDFHHADVYNREKEQYRFNIDTEIFMRNFADQDACKQFRQFDNLKTLGMLEEFSLPLRLTGGVTADVDFFSDGQFQLAYIYAIVELFKDRNCVTLLDEPDAFLHPEWQFEFLKQVFEISEEATAKNHVLLSSHSAVTLIPHERTKIKFFDIRANVVNCYELPKRVAIQKLSANLIKYSEQEQLLSIINAIQIEKKPVLFTEGSTDPLIIKEAWADSIQRICLSFRSMRLAALTSSNCSPTIESIRRWEDSLCSPSSISMKRTTSGTASTALCCKKIHFKAKSRNGKKGSPTPSCFRFPRMPKSERNRFTRQPARPLAARLVVRLSTSSTVRLGRQLTLWMSLALAVRG